MRQVVLHPDSEDGGWIVEVPSLPGCYAQGNTKAQALDDARHAITAWIEGAQATGQAIPRRLAIG